jgi:hypothetical protein
MGFGVTRTPKKKRSNPNSAYLKYILKTAILWKFLKNPKLAKLAVTYAIPILKKNAYIIMRKFFWFQEFSKIENWR